MNIFKNKNLNYIVILNEWLSNKKNIKIQTFQKYECLINNYLKNTLGKMKVKDINQKSIIHFFDSREQQKISGIYQFLIIKSSKTIIRWLFFCQIYVFYIAYFVRDVILLF